MTGPRFKILNVCQLAIGDFCCSIVCDDAALVNYLRRYYSGFLLKENEPDFTIELCVDHSPVPSYRVPNSLLAAKAVEGTRFSFGFGILAGSLYLPDNRCEVIVHESLLRGRCIRIFEQFLYQIYYTLLYINGTQPESFLIHSSGVVREGKGFVFAGCSGSGKTTIASLSSQEKVLNDEMVIIEKQNSHFQVKSTPFNGYFRNKKDGSAPLKAIFLLKHDTENNLKPLSKADFVSKFVREVVPSIHLLSTDNNKAYSEMLGFCSQLVAQIPLYQLGFRPDRGFWECIEKENLL